jgi:purine nucleosidase
MARKEIMKYHHESRLSWGVLASLIGAALIAFLFTPTPVRAQPPEPEPDAVINQLFLPMIGGGGNGSAAAVDEAGAAARPGAQASLKLIIDTDPGVDDALALAWLFSQRERRLIVLGIVSVAGNASITNTTSNVLTILNRAGISGVPVVKGAAAPLVQRLSKTSYFLHGPDGLWFQGSQNLADIPSLPNDAASFYCDTLAINSDAMILALGPLTNLANALNHCPDNRWNGIPIIVLGGAKFGGNKTPVAEFNFWQDPEAVERLLLAAGTAYSPGPLVKIVPFDTFSQATIDRREVDRLATKGNAVMRFLAPALLNYITVQEQNGATPVVPDAVAALFAVDSSVGTTLPALTKIVTETGKARGQSIVGLSVAERLGMIASDDELSALAEAFFIPPSFDLQAALGGILFRELDNSQFMNSVRRDVISRNILPSLRSR